MRTSEYDSLNVMDVNVRRWGIDLADWLAGFDLVSVCAGPSGELYALAVTAPADYREVAPSGVNFPKVSTERPHDVRVIRFDGDDVTAFVAPSQHYNFSFVQPLPENEILLVGARSRRYTDGTYDLNAHVYGENGDFRRAFLLGDGIADVQVTSDGRIWTSYFDEGVYGNFGWDVPIGASGLILWDHFGNQLYEYAPPKGVGSIDDCYYLNAASDTEVWCYYFSSYPLIRIRDGAVDGVWQEMHGAHIVTAWDRFGIFACT